MFNNLTRTLKMGLTAITILIAGGFAFAPTAAHANPTYIANCKANPWGAGEYYFRNWWHRVRNLKTYHFSPGGCAAVFGQKQLSYERVRWCSTGYNYTSSVCTAAHSGIAGRAINDRPNSANFVKKSYASATPSTAYRRNQILRGARNSVPAGGGFTLRHWGNLNLGSTTFNNVPLGGDDTDGTGFFTGQVNGVGNYYSYSGLFAVTDLGAPLTQRSGTATWVGHFQSVGHYENKDFVLEVDYGARTLDAFVQQSGGYHYLLDAEYDTTGYITGSIIRAHYSTNDRTRRDSTYGTGYTSHSGYVRGVIGQEGAVGAFVSYSSGVYSGGFVARPANTTQRNFITTTCNLPYGDPFHEYCQIGNTSKAVMDAQRSSRIGHCIQGNNAISDTTKCRNAVKRTPCISNPFKASCATDSSFRSHNANARTARRAFCNISSNARNSLCTNTETVADLCSSNLFGAVCLNSSGYESQRVARARTCAASRYSSGCSSVPITQVCSRVPFGTYCTSSSYASQRLARAKTCAASRYATGCSSSYGVTTSKICSLVPFGATCTSSSYESYRVTRAKTCAANRYASGCSSSYGVTTSKVCSRVPFGSTCTSSSYESYRVTRAKTCAANRSASGCSSSYGVTTSKVCSRVPFGATCTSSTYESQRITRAKTCAANRYATGCDSSYGVSTSKICSRIPFGTACTSSSYESQRIARARTCAANRYATGCDSSYGVSLSKVCTRVPFGTYCTSSTYESQRIARAKTCAANRSASGCSSSYGVTTSKVCSRVPFGSTCTSSSYESYRVTQAKVCAANRYATGCNSSYGVTTSKFCSRIPFGTYCTSNSYETQRIAQAKICAANRSATGCNSSYGVTTSKICTHVPFVTSCSSSSYESHRVARAKVCAANRSDSSRCGSDQGVTTSSICTRVPFGTACSSSSYESQRIAQAKICAANLSATGCNSSYGVTTSKVCTLVPFGTACSSSSYESDRVERAKICAANLSDSRCTTGQNITTADICSRVPFGTACSSSSYESDRIARAKACAADRGDSRCTSAHGVTTSKICSRAAFVGVCVDDGNFDDERTSRLEFCDIATNSNHPNCTDTNLSDICNYAPFSPFCLKHTGSITKRTDTAFNACRPSDSDDPKCYGISKMPSGGLKPDVATWVDGFVTKANPGGLSSVVDINRGSQFVEAGKTNLDQTGIHLVHRSATLLRAGDTTDGVGFLWGETRTGSQIFVAGILAETDLGAPITEATKTSVVWRGEFQSLRYDTKTDFDLQISFGPSGTGSIEAFIERKIGEYDFVNTPHYYLDGRFDANGLITGRVIAGRFVNETPTTGTDYAYQGVLRGIIGEDGAVGAFVGGKSRDNGITFHTAGHFAGGFVAAPAEVVEYADWEDIFNPDSTRTSPLTNQFLAGSDGTVASGSPVTITFANASYGGASFNGDGKDGVQLFTNPTNGAVTNVYAGILTTTNLGAPLDATTAAAVWEGRLFASLVTGAPAYEVADFRPYIDFNESSMDATITGVTQSDGTALARSVVYSFYAEFDTRGVIDGTITRSSKGRASTGELTGLIGAEGAVGAFISDPNARVPYAGGFVARPTQ